MTNCFGHHLDFPVGARCIHSRNEDIHSGSLAILTKSDGFRSMALRHRFSPGLPLRIFFIYDYSGFDVKLSLNSTALNLQDCKESNSISFSLQKVRLFMPSADFTLIATKKPVFATWPTMLRPVCDAWSVTLLINLRHAFRLQKRKVTLLSPSPSGWRYGIRKSSCPGPLL